MLVIAGPKFASSRPGQKTPWQNVRVLLTVLKLRREGKLGSMQIYLNGEAMTVPESITVAQLLEELKKDPKFLAVERNQELVPRTEHRNCQLAANDAIEIVTLVGGG